MIGNGHRIAWKLLFRNGFPTLEKKASPDKDDDSKYHSHDNDRYQQHFPGLDQDSSPESGSSFQPLDEIIESSWQRYSRSSP